MSERAESLLKELIHWRSVTGEELGAAQCLLEFLQKQGAKAELDEFETGRANVYAWHIANPQAPLLILCSHLDVVPPGETDKWRSEPWELCERADRFYGRGVCDAKGQLAAMTEAFLRLAEDKSFGGNLCLAAVAGEEKGGVGAKRFSSRIAARWAKSPAYCVIGEPTEAVPCIEHMGRIEFTLRLHGEECHAARAQNERNAAVNGARLLMELLPRVANPRACTDAGGQATIALTRLEARAENTNTVPGCCTLVFDRRFVHTEDPAEICRAFEKECALAARALNIAAELNCRIGIHAAHTPSDSPIAQAALEGCAALGLRRELGFFGAVCDMYAFAAAHIPTVILGCGDLLQNHAHGADEYMEKAAWEQLIRIYVHTAQRLFQP